ncbi:MAG: MGMT family protein [Pseudomonadota bacterium]|nr:MGMT family protein [Pseudomonadota bacterium]
MARTADTFAELFLPHRFAGPRTRRVASAPDSPVLQSIWDVVGMIPRGRVSTYGAVARAAGLPGRARLTGFALKVAPSDMNLPWHRVVGAGGRIVFAKTSLQHREQARRLRAEKVAVKDGRVDRACMTDSDAL